MFRRVSIIRTVCAPTLALAVSPVACSRGMRFGSVAKPCDDVQIVSGFEANSIYVANLEYVRFID